MTKALFLIGAVFLACMRPAVADIYTCKHADGSTEFTNTPCGKGATTAGVMRDPYAARAPETSTQESTKMVRVNNNFSQSSTRPVLMARVEPNVQRNRDDIRRRVLSTELESEEKSLTDMRAQWNGGNPTVLADESAASPKYLERRARLQQTVSLHEKNVAAIKQELSNLR